MNTTKWAIREALADAEAGSVAYFPLDATEAQLRSAWEPIAIERYRSRRGDDEGDVLKQVADDDDITIEFTPSKKRPPPWFVGLSKSFRRAVERIDRKLQGRILEALGDITSDPLTPRGDTVKPLRGDLVGCWRYRIGDYRLVYSPDATTGDITLLAFAARGDIYDA